MFSMMKMFLIITATLANRGFHLNPPLRPNYFNFIEIFKKHEVKLANRTPPLFTSDPIFRSLGSAPGMVQAMGLEGAVLPEFTRFAIINLHDTLVYQGPELQCLLRVKEDLS